MNFECCLKTKSRTLLQKPWVPSPGMPWKAQKYQVNIIFPSNFWIIKDRISNLWIVQNKSVSVISEDGVTCLIKHHLIWELKDHLYWLLKYDTSLVNTKERSFFYQLPTLKKISFWYELFLKYFLFKNSSHELFLSS